MSFYEIDPSLIYINGLRKFNILLKKERKFSEPVEAYFKTL